MLLYFITEPYLLIMLLQALTVLNVEGGNILFLNTQPTVAKILHAQPIVAKNIFCRSEFIYLYYVKKKNFRVKEFKIMYCNIPEKHSEHNALQSSENPEPTDFINKTKAGGDKKS